MNTLWQNEWLMEKRHQKALFYVSEDINWIVLGLFVLLKKKETQISNHH